MSERSARDLLDAAQKSGLLTAADVQACAAALDTARVVLAADAAVKLVERRTLTEFQIEQLLAGRGDECVLAGRYRILQKLGEGAMGAVFQATDTKLDRTVAIKVLPPASLDDPDAVARFQREAKALAKLSHPNIIQAHDVGEDRGRHFVVMEYVAGTNLHRLLGEKGPLPPARASDYIYQAALGLQHAHEKGLVHRDLKPSNLLLTPEGQIKIVDLGLARFLQDQISDPHRTCEGMGMGTPDYMPPEQFSNAHNADARADIYSLGCTLYHLLTGSVPFPGSSLIEKCRAHQHREPPTLEERCPDAPTGLAMVISRMLAKRPQDRFQTAAEVAEAIAPYVASATASSRQIKATCSWQGSSIFAAKPPPKRSYLTIVLAIVVAVMGLALFVPRVLEVNRKPVVSGDVVAPEDHQPTTATDPNVLTVSQDLKQGGTFRTISAALESARPGITVRVLDDAEYNEFVLLSGGSRHAGITLESPRHATISATRARTAAIKIGSVPGVTIRGFRLRSDAPGLSMIDVRGPCPGLLVDGVEMTAGSANDYDGFFIQGVPLEKTDLPVIIQNCTVRSPQTCLVVVGFSLDVKTPMLCSRVVFRNNRVINASARGVSLNGQVRQVHVVGNRFESGSGYSVIQFQHMKDAEDLLVANNTIFEPISQAFRLWDEAVVGERIELRNNLVLATTMADMIYIDSGGDNANPRGPGDPQQVLQKWLFTNNWRETTKPIGENILTKSWIPPGALDVIQEQIEVLSRNPDDPDFLRPAADSPLATNGAGNEIADLPRYVGAVPPRGVEPWDWQKTWDSRNKRPAP